MEEFSCKTKLICGSGAVSRLADFQAKRLFLVSDPFFVKNGTAQKIADGLVINNKTETYPLMLL